MTETAASLGNIALPARVYLRAGLLAGLAAALVNIGIYWVMIGIGATPGHL